MKQDHVPPIDTLVTEIAGLQSHSMADHPKSQVGEPSPQHSLDNQTEDRIEPPSTTRSAGQQLESLERRSAVSELEYDVPESYANIPEVAERSPVRGYDENPEEKEEPGVAGAEELSPSAKDQEVRISRVATEIYTVSYLVLFSILGTLARLGLQALTYYPGAPVTFSSVWPNFAGSLVMGFLSEDRKLFRHEWGIPRFDQHIRRAKQKITADEESGEGSPSHQQLAAELQAAKKAYMATKKTIPLYIGLATGFCGSFTSFSSLIRDMLLATSNDLPSPDIVSATIPRNGGYSFMALVAVTITTIGLSLSGLFIGAHLALALEPVTPSLPFQVTRKILDPFAVFLAWGCWIGAVLLSILPPDRFTNLGAAETWRGRATFALVFAPLGCLLRFYASLHLNPRAASFPVGTFTVNIFGTAVLGMAWDLAHIPLGGVIGCQVLQGVEDGFCGALTTVSTWVGELAGLRRRQSYIYGSASIVVAYAVMVAIMGGLRWSRGFENLACLH